jgi:segregation and condensation protein B
MNEHGNIGTAGAADVDELDEVVASPPAALLAPLDVDDETLRRGIAGILFVADEPTTVQVLAETLGIPVTRIGEALGQVRDRFEGLGIDLIEIAGGWRLMTSPAARPVLERWIIGARHGRLTQAALETLAVVAYRQPIARVTIGEIRGVNPDGALRSLMARGLVAEVGREDGPGQAVLFGTTAQFLERMGLRSLSELPPLPPYLPDGPAPDEPDAGGLAALRKRLRDGSQRLGEAGSMEASAGEERLAGAGLMQPEEDDDDEAMAPPTPRARRADEGEIIDLSDRLEQAARSAMGRLRHVKATQAQADADADADAAGSDVNDDGGDDAPAGVRGGSDDG